MCGIVGYLGKDNALSMVRSKIKLLEYRGYDSSGYCVIDSTNNEFLIKKTIGTIDKIKNAAEKLGTPSVLINNAGLRIHDDFEKITYEDWKKVMTVNVDASFLCTQALIGHMTKQKWGRVINIGGLSAHIGAKERAHVVTSKAALIGLTKAISMEFLERGITCNCVVPGFIEDFDSKEKALTGHWLRHPQTPNLVLNRFGNPDEVAEVIANLCKKEADYINGQTLHVNGGSFTP